MSQLAIASSVRPRWRPSRRGLTAEPRQLRSAGGRLRLLGELRHREDRPELAALHRRRRRGEAGDGTHRPKGIDIYPAGAREVLVRNSSMERSLASLRSKEQVTPSSFIQTRGNPTLFPAGFYGTAKFFLSKLAVHTKNCLRTVSQVARSLVDTYPSPTSPLAATLPCRLVSPPRCHVVV